LAGFDSHAAESLLIPSAALLQVGTAGHTHSQTVGLIWDWDAKWAIGAGELTGYFEGTVSQWSYSRRDDSRNATLGQFGLIPVFRYMPDHGKSGWFVEGGVGATVTTNVYETQRKRFSTSFNFGDHVGLGLDFGTKRQHELLLRIEHFSNGSIKEPNPGENFMEIRYVYRFQ
jgi:hypothetical protein